MRETIYDVGVNDGADTAYYLHRGFRVVGIEASPIAAVHLRDRFAREIADGSFTLLNIGIASQSGNFPFWICEDHPEWSSFDQRIASREGASHHKVIVPTARFGDVMEEQGSAHYCKIDIEGHDRICLDSITRAQAPPFISIEMGHGDGDKAIKSLSALGYRRFKIISQRTWAQPTRFLTRLAFQLPRLARVLAFQSEKRVRGKTTDAGWRFPFGSSGTFGERTPGAWLDADDTLSLWRFLRDVDARHGTQGLGDWYDIHAAR